MIKAINEYSSFLSFIVHFFFILVQTNSVHLEYFCAQIFTFKIRCVQFVYYFALLQSLSVHSSALTVIWNAGPYHLSSHHFYTKKCWHAHYITLFKRGSKKKTHTPNWPSELVQFKMALIWPAYKKQRLFRNLYTKKKIEIESEWTTISLESTNRLWCWIQRRT